MTLSREARLQEMRDTLRMVSEDVGDAAVWKIDIEAKSDRYKHVHETTWKHLLDQGLIKFRFFDSYNLTAYGWRKGLEVRRLDKDRSFQAKLGRLSKVLKDEVKGRKAEGYLDVSQVAERSGLSEDFIFNSIEADILWHFFNMHGAHFDGPHSREIVIPFDFGMEPVEPL